MEIRLLNTTRKRLLAESRFQRPSKGFKMKIRLSWKLFGVMMFNVVLIVGVMVVIMNLLVSREFQGYIRANDLERFQNVKEGLQQYYSFY